MSKVRALTPNLPVVAPGKDLPWRVGAGQRSLLMVLLLCGRRRNIPAWTHIICCQDIDPSQFLYCGGAEYQADKTALMQTQPVLHSLQLCRVDTEEMLACVPP